jgi:hypothetical protein
MPKLALTVVIIAAVIACAMFGLVAYSVIMASLACLIGGLTVGFVGTLVLTNKFQMNYEVAFSRSFLSGASLTAAVVVVWTAVLNLLSGGLTANLVSHLWDVSLRCALGGFGAAVVSVVVWASLVFGGRKSGG